MPKLITVVDDEQDILELVLLHLKKAGYAAEGFLDAARYFKFIEKKIPDLLILDLMLPDTDGLEVCRYMKNKDGLSSIPIIMLTAKAEETDKILGLELGADDYITKPFSPKELVARVKAVLRRREKVEEKKQFSFGDISLDAERYEVMAKGKKIELTATEFRILHLLASRPGRVFNRDEILDHLWGHEKAVIDRTIDVHIRHLREKLGPAGKVIRNIRGVGYKVDE